MARAISFWVGLSFSARVENQAKAWRTERAVAWLICSPAILTASGSGRIWGAGPALHGRAPWQVSQEAELWYLASSSRIQADSVWSIRRFKLPITPSNGFLTS